MNSPNADVQIWADAVRTATELDAATKGLLLVMQVRMNPDGTSCYPGMPWLMASTGYGQRQVRYLLARAVAAGYLERIEGTGHRGAAAEFRAVIPLARLQVTGRDDGGGWRVARAGKHANAVIDTTAFDVALEAARKELEAAERRHSGAANASDRRQPSAAKQTDRRHSGAAYEGERRHSEGRKAAPLLPIGGTPVPPTSTDLPLRDTSKVLSLRDNDDTGNTATSKRRLCAWCGSKHGLTAAGTFAAHSDADGYARCPGSGREPSEMAGPCECCGREGMRGPDVVAKCWTCYRKAADGKRCTHA